jgi:vanillate O-demethylase ferredoxin subunit
MNLLTLKVSRRWEEAQGIVALELVHPEGKLLPPFEAGAHIDLHITSTIVRQYSLCNSPIERHRYVVGVLNTQSKGGGSQFLHETLRDGALIAASAPRNLFPLVPARHTILVGAGIGITPILSMAEALADGRDSFEGHYFVRSLDNVAFGARFHHPDMASRFSIHSDNVDGMDVGSLRLIVRNPEAEKHLFVCGPPGFLNVFCGFAADAGWPPENIHIERFAPSFAPATENKPFYLKLASSGQRLFVGTNQSALEVLTGAGIEVPSSCERGVCGACITRLVGGVAEHRDDYLSNAERNGGGVFIPCCSRAQTDELVLDL